VKILLRGGFYILGGESDLFKLAEKRLGCYGDARRKGEGVAAVKLCLE